MRSRSTATLTQVIAIAYVRNGGGRAPGSELSRAREPAVAKRYVRKALLAGIQPFWQHVRARAGLKDVRIHDLRHTFASTAVAARQGSPMIGKLLSHNRFRRPPDTLISRLIQSRMLLT